MVRGFHKKKKKFWIQIKYCSIIFLVDFYSLCHIFIIWFWRVPCKRRGGVRFTLKGQSSFNMVMISNVGGGGNVKAAWIRGSRTRTWLPMNRNWGANWQSSVDLRNQRLTFKLTLVDGKTMEFLNVVPSTWKFGQTFASTRQFF